MGVYPNPTQGVLNINFELANSAASTQIKLVDIKGRTVKQIAEDFVGRGFNRAQVDITNLPTGIYFLTIQSGDSVITKRVVKN